jgi:hypothetical protein
VFGPRPGRGGTDRARYGRGRDHPGRRRTRAGAGSPVAPVVPKTPPAARMTVAANGPLSGKRRLSIPYS